MKPLISRGIRYNDWFNLTFEVDCSNQITKSDVVLYTPGRRYPIEISEELVMISNPSPCDGNRKNFSISINMTEEVHQLLDSVLTVSGQNPSNPSMGCISFPSARYYILETVPPIFSTPGESVCMHAWFAYNISAFYNHITLEPTPTQGTPCNCSTAIKQPVSIPVCAGSAALQCSLTAVILTILAGLALYFTVL